MATVPARLTDRTGSAAIGQRRPATVLGRGGPSLVSVPNQRPAPMVSCS